MGRCLHLGKSEPVSADGENFVASFQKPGSIPLAPNILVIN